MFVPLLAGYWGSTDRGEAADVVLDIIAANVDKVDGIKVSLLDADKEIALRERLPEGVRMYTGDDFNYPDLIKSGSDALLGIFDAIAPAAAAAMHALDEGDLERYDELLAPTVPLSRHIFAAPTPYYKTGVVFLAYLNGHQEHFRMVGGLESGRSVRHLSELFVLADQAGLLREPDLAAARMRLVLDLAGVC
jgi:dihydrodipicolinate synthase/N-acetylneuraminate lyase